MPRSERLRRTQGQLSVDHQLMRFAAALKRRRVELGLGVGDAARIAGVHRSAWNAWESGMKRPMDSSLRGIADAMQWQVAEVQAKLDGTEPRRFAHRDDQALWETGEREGWPEEMREELIRVRREWEARARARRDPDQQAG